MSCCCSAQHEEEKEEEEVNDGVEMQDAVGSSGKNRTPVPSFKVKRGNRSCTDLICLLLFVICLVGLGFVFYFAIKTGDPYTLLYPTDSQGNLCGYSNRTKQLKYLVFFDLIECLKMGPTAILAGGCPTSQVCVEKCPNRNWAWMELWLRESVTGSVDVTRRKSNMICQYGDPQNDTSMSVSDLVRDRMCAPYYLNSTSIAGRCIPSIFGKGIDLAQKIFSENGEEIRTADNQTEVRYRDISSASSYLSLFLSTITVAQNAFHDVVESRYLILVGVILGAILAFIWCFMLRFTAAIMVYGSLFLFFLIFAASTAYCLFIYVTDASLQSVDEALGNSYFTTNFSLYLRLKETWLGLGILSGTVLLIVLVLLVFLRKRLQLAVAIIKEASKAIATVPATLIFPMWPLLFQICVIIIFAANAALLSASGKKVFAATNSSSGETTTCEQTQDNYLGCQFVFYAGENWNIYLQAFNLFMAFWISAFIIAFAQLVLAGAFASYYWAWSKPQDIPSLPLFTSVCIAIRYHLGTVAFGSLLIAIVKMIRAIISYVESKLKDSQNLLSQFLFCCLKCFFWCLEKFLKYLSKNAYIVTAIKGKNFCLAAKQAFGIIFSNCLRFAVVDNITSFVLFIAKLIVTALISALATMFFQGKLRFNSYIQSFEVQLHYFFVPVILIALSTWIICSLFFSVFDFAVDTMLMCAMVDYEKNDGSAQKPYFMSRELMKILDAKNRFGDINSGQDKDFT